MRSVEVTNKNRSKFQWSDTNDVDLLLTFDELLHDKGLELIIGKTRVSSDYCLAISEVLEDCDYDRDEAKAVLFGRA